MAHTNKTLANDIETVFLSTSNEYSFLSSSVVREIARFGGEISHLVTNEVAIALRQKFQQIHSVNGNESRPQHKTDRC